MDDYKDIIHLSRPISKRPKMDLMQRAAQFAAFAALTGYEDQIEETARLTNKKIEINEEAKIMLDLKMHTILERIEEQPEIKVTYFIPDQKKEGGRYITKVNKVKKVDAYKSAIIMVDGTVIKIQDVIEIQGEFFNA